VTLTTTRIDLANFASGAVIDGQVTEFIVVPEPGTLLLAVVGSLAGFGWVSCRCRRNHRSTTTRS